MSTFLQLHVLTTYAAANLNRDDTGRPKTLVFGGADRLRISSQSLKRAFRTSDVFADTLASVLGTRSNTFTESLVKVLRSRNLSDEDIIKRVSAVIEKDKLGKPKKEKPLDTEQLVHLGPEELQRLDALADRLVAGDELADKEAVVLVQKPRAADIALFGRMLADNPLYNVEAAAQVAHAFTTHKVSVEDDFYTAVDDLKSADPEADRGAGFIGITEYGAGIFYLYVCLDASQLVRNLADDKELAGTTAEAFVEAITTVSPKGKQNSFASRAYASFALAELGSRSPRSLAAAFLDPIGPRHGIDYGSASVKALHAMRKSFDEVYGHTNKRAHLDVLGAGADGPGSLASLKTLAREAVNAVQL
jgi:CRISPR system Cascade subunit CasC